MKLLIDECLHTSLVTAAHSAGHSADHVSHRGLGGLKDWQLMRVIREQEYTFVTNNRSDFLDLHAKERLHAGVIEFARDRRSTVRPPSYLLNYF